MKRFIIMMVMMLSVSMVHAYTYLDIDVGSLSETQKAEMMMQVAKMKEAAKTAVVPNIEKVREYSELVTAIGGGVKETAKELGIAANDFVKTPVGMLTAGLIAWNYIGRTILGVVVGGVWFLVMIPGWVYFYRRLVLIKSIEYYTKGARDDGKRKEVIFTDKYDEKISDGVHFTLWATLIIICGLGLLIILN